MEKLKQFYNQNNTFDDYWTQGAQYLLNTYGVDIEQPWETIPDDVLQRILRDPNYSFYIDGPNEGLSIS